MRLARYLAIYYAGAVMLTLGGLVTLVVAAGLIESAGTLTRAGASAASALQVALLQGVSFAYQIVPAACFLGALIAGTTLARRGELLGIQTTGIGPRRVLVGFAAVAALAGALDFAAGEWLVPKAVAAQARARREGTRRNDAVSSFFGRRAQWYRTDELVLHLPADQLEPGVFADPTVYELSRGELMRVIDAARLVHGEGGWRLEEARVLDVDAASATLVPTVPVALSVRPADLADLTGDPRQLGWRDVKALATRRAAAGFDATAHLVELHDRAAYPASALVILFMVMPWAVHPERRRSLAVNLGAGVVVISVLFALTYVFRLLALGHKVPAVFGAWGLTLTCALAIAPSYWLYERYRRRGTLL